MYRIRLIYAIVLATAFTLLIAWAGALIVAPSSEWYLGLNKPEYMTSNGVFSAVWGVNYCIVICFLSRLLSLKKYTPCLPVIAAINVLSVIWLAVFFRAHAVLIALMLMLLLVALNVVNLYMMLIRKWQLALMYTPILVIYCYSFVLNYSIFLLN